MKLGRRSFLKLVGLASAVATFNPLSLLPKLEPIPEYFGVDMASGADVGLFSREGFIYVSESKPYEDLGEGIELNIVGGYTYGEYWNQDYGTLAGFKPL